MPQKKIGDIHERVTRSMSHKMSHFAHSAFVASFEPRNVGYALLDSNWENAMHEGLENFERNQVWVLVLPPHDCHPIGIKWVFKNKQGGWVGSEKQGEVGTSSVLPKRGDRL